MLTLAVDTSTAQGSVAILDRADNVVAKKSWHRQKSHSEVVTATTQECLHLANCKLSDISLICVGIGPGSFTGIRVSVNLARSLSYSLNIPIRDVISLRALAEPALTSDVPVLAMINAFKNMAYIAAYKFTAGSTQCLVEPKALSMDQLETLITSEHICVGDGFEVFEPQMSPQLRSRFVRQPNLSDYPEAEVLGRIGLKEFDSTYNRSWNEVKPLYIRASEAEEKLRKGLLKPIPKI